MHIYPAIDLARTGQVVRLEQGRAEAQTVYGSTTRWPSRSASTPRRAPRHLHMVDLDGAFTGEFKNLKLVEAGLARPCRCSSRWAVACGAARRSSACWRSAWTRAVIGTAACESLSFVRDMVAKFGGGSNRGRHRREERHRLHQGLDRAEPVDRAGPRPGCRGRGRPAPSSTPTSRPTACSPAQTCLRSLELARIVPQVAN